ncbi:MAG: head decoration protein [Rhodocyclaceae bacterium]|nr:head decoration protein [Rhodocyclaceae bacterium]
MATEAARAGDFLIAEANGTLSRDEVTIVSGQNLAAGTVLGKITASGKMTAYSNVAADGSQTAVGILYDAVDASAADAPGVMIARHAEVISAELVGLDAAGETDLAALAIIAR